MVRYTNKHELMSVYLQRAECKQEFLLTTTSRLFQTIENAFSAISATRRPYHKVPLHASVERQAAHDSEFSNSSFLMLTRW